MACKIYLRHDQSISQRETSKSEKVFVYAPSWVKEGIKILAGRLKNTEFTVLEKPNLKRGPSGAKVCQDVNERFKITEDFDNYSLVLLQRIARNEPRNTTGKISTSYYKPAISDVALLCSLKDLARQTVIVGKDTTTFSGGYKSPRLPQKEPVYLCDLAGLQFQQHNNSGRLVLIQENDAYVGPLDDLIFENVVGEKRKVFKDVVELTSEDKEATKRYLKHSGFGKSGKGSCFMDAFAYKRFVKLDVVLSGLALAEVASVQGDKLNFKFLRYGTGKFAGNFGKQLNFLILEGVLDGMEELFGTHGEKVMGVIKCLSFPFYEIDPESKKRLEKLKQAYKIDYEFSRMDALKQTKPGKGLVTATTNCANSYAACGNTMGQSTDGTIAQNLKSRGNIFCPNMNSSMKYKYIEI